jgi:hypothetical protein
MHTYAKILAAVRRASSWKASANIYIEQQPFTLIVQYLSKEKPFLVLHCTSKKH